MNDVAQRDAIIGMPAPGVVLQMHLMELTYTGKEVEQKRDKVAQQFIASSPHLCGEQIEHLSTLDLQLLFNLYEKEFFEGTWAEEVGTEPAFSLSTRMTRSAGKTITKRKPLGAGQYQTSFEIRIGVNFLFQFDAVNRSKTVCGLPAPSALWALLLVFEHELCHVVESAYFKTSNCSKERFKALAHRLFGHISSYHALPTAQEIAYQEHGLRVGDEVTFFYQDKLHTGRISAINKRATIMVPTRGGSYIDGKGVRYSKFYTPLNALSVR